MTSQARRKPQPANDPGIAGLRDIIQQAISAYELAVATQARTAAEAQRRQRERLAELDEQESAGARQREQSLHDQQSIAMAEAERVQALSALAGDLTESASSLLEQAALAYVRGFGPGSTDVKPHVATGEQVAAAFAAAHLASVDLRAAVLRLAAEYVHGRDWPRARQILAALIPGASGALLDEATALFRTACLGEAAAALESGDPGKARTQAAAWLRSHNGDEAFTDLLSKATDAIRERELGRVRERLAGGAAEQARDQAAAWLQGHEHDAGFQELLLQATITLAEQALASGDQARAADEVLAVRQQIGVGHAQLKEVMRRHPAIAWRTGESRLLREFGGHSQPVRDLAFTADGDHLVSRDQAEAKIWDARAAAHGQLLDTISVPGTTMLTPDGILALSRNGDLRRTGDESYAGQAGLPLYNALPRDGSLFALAARNRHWELEYKLSDFGSATYSYASGASRNPHSDPDQLSLINTQINLYVRLWINDFAHAESPKTIGGFPVAVTPGTYPYGNPLRASFIGSVSVTDIADGSKLCTVVLPHSHLFVDFAVSAGARMVAVLEPSGELILADIDSGRRVHSFKTMAAQSMLNTVCFSPRGDLILITDVSASTAVGAEQRTGTTRMTMWDTSTGGVAGSWTTQRREGAAIFSPDGQLIAVLALDGTITIIDVGTQRSVGAIQVHPPEAPPRLAFSPDGSLLASSGGRTVTIWGL